MDGETRRKVSRSLVIFCRKEKGIDTQVPKLKICYTKVDFWVNWVSLRKVSFSLSTLRKAIMRERRTCSPPFLFSYDRERKTCRGVNERWGVTTVIKIEYLCNVIQNL